MTDQTASQPVSGHVDRFRNSRRLVWVTLVGVFGLCGAAIWHDGTNAVPVLTTTLPSMLALVGAWTGVTNMAAYKWSKERR